MGLLQGGGRREEQDSRVAEGTQKVTLSLEDEGGIHVKDTPWGAWLRNLKMMDWRRLGETFDVTDSIWLVIISVMNASSEMHISAHSGQQLSLGN